MMEGEQTVSTQPELTLPLAPSSDESSTQLKALAAGAREVSRIRVDAVEELESAAHGASPPA